MTASSDSSSAAAGAGLRIVTAPRWRASAERLGARRLRGLQLGEHDADSVAIGEAWVTASRVDGVVGAGGDEDAVGPVPSTQIGATPVTPSATADTCVVSIPLPFEVGDGRPAEVVVADAADERHRRAEACRHHRLVRPLAAEPLLVAVGDQRLALFGHPLAVRDLVDHHRPDDDDRRDVRWVGQAHGRHRAHEAARRRGGGPADQPRVEAHGTAGAGDVARQSGEQHAHGDRALVLHVAVDDGERRIEEVGEEMIVEADDRHGPRHRQTEVAQRPQQADVIRLLAANAALGGSAVPNSRIAAWYPPRSLKSATSMSTSTSAASHSARKPAWRSAPGVVSSGPLTKAMRRCPSSISSRAAASGAAGVVDQHGVGVARIRQRAVDEDDRDAELGERLRRLGVVTGRRQQEAVDTVADRRQHTVLPSPSSRPCCTGRADSSVPWATDSAPLTTPAKNGLVTSGTTSPIVSVRPDFSELASADGR